MKAKRWQILGALAAGCAVGYGTAVVMMSSGCSLLFLATARADDVTTVECTMSGQKAEFTLPDDTPETFSRLSIVLSVTACNVGGTTHQAKSADALDGKVTLACPDVDCQGHSGHPHGTFSFIMH